MKNIKVGDITRLVTIASSSLLPPKADLQDLKRLVAICYSFGVLFTLHIISCYFQTYQAESNVMTVCRMVMSCVFF